MLYAGKEGSIKDEVFNPYNNIVQSAGSAQLARNPSLQGTKEKWIDDYTGCGTADDENFSDAWICSGNASKLPEH